MSTDTKPKPTKSSTTTQTALPLDGSCAVANQCGGAAAEARTAGRLVNKRKNVDAAPVESAEEAKKKRRKRDNRRTRYADQRQAAKLYRHFSQGEKKAGRGVTMCGWTMRADKKSVDVMREDKKDGANVYYDGLVTCGLAWVCPCCSVKKSEERRQRVNQAFKNGRARGLIPVMLTLTARHTRRTKLAPFLAQLRDAWRVLVQSRKWKAFNLEKLLGGFAKALEVTDGGNGWHPHFHVILLVDEASEEAAIEAAESLADAWFAALEKVGLDGKTKAARTYAFHVQGAAAAGNYVAKWGAAEELTLTQNKDGKKEGSMTPWEMLTLSRTSADDKERRRCAARWWEFVQATKGAHQLEASPKFKELMEGEDDDGEEEPSEVNRIGQIRRRGWHERGRWRRLTIKEKGESCSLEDAPQAVKDTIASNITDFDLVDDYDPGPLIE